MFADSLPTCLQWLTRAGQAKASNQQLHLSLPHGCKGNKCSTAFLPKHVRRKLECKWRNWELKWHPIWDPRSTFGNLTLCSTTLAPLFCIFIVTLFRSEREVGEREKKTDFQIFVCWYTLSTGHNNQVWARPD